MSMTSMSDPNSHRRRLPHLFFQKKKKSNKKRQKTHRVLCSNSVSLNVFLSRTTLFGYAIA